MTELDWVACWEAQRGRCGICGLRMLNRLAGEKGHISRRPVVDHDHETGVRRGLLCFNCNKRLHRDGAVWLRGAIAYLQRAAVTGVLALAAPVSSPVPSVTSLEPVDPFTPALAARPMNRGEGARPSADGAAQDPDNAILPAERGVALGLDVAKARADVNHDGTYR